MGPVAATKVLTIADSARAGALQIHDMTLGEMRALLATHDLRLTRSLGQNFLHDGNQLRRIVALAALPPAAPVLEIGPGLGPLTEHLLAAGHPVLAIEKDARLIPILRTRLGDRPGLEVRHADALEWLQDQPRGWGGWHLVANLPYSVGSPILVELAHAPVPPDSLTVTLQAEVIDRLRAAPGTSEYGVLTLLLAAVYEPGAAFRIPASCFFPPPDVGSACLRLSRRATPLVMGAVADTYRRVVKTAFSQRRKRLRKVLGHTWPSAPLDAAWADLALDPDVRPENVGPAAFAELARRLT